MRTKKLAAKILAVIMVLTLALPQTALAARTYNVKIALGSVTARATGFDGDQTLDSVLFAIIHDSKNAGLEEEIKAANPGASQAMKDALNELKDATLDQWGTIIVERGVTGTLAEKLSSDSVPTLSQSVGTLTATYEGLTVTVTVSSVSDGGSSGGSSSGTESGTTTPGGSTTETTTNEDGSTTETTTETTSNEDGSTTETTTETTTSTDGSTTEVVTETTTTADGSTQTVTTETVEKADGTTATMTTVVDINGAASTEASVSVSAQAVEQAAASGSAVTVPVTVAATKSAETAPVVNVSVPASTSSEKGVKVEIPVENVTPGTVVVIVAADGTEQIVRASTLTENGVALNVQGDVTVKVVDNSKDFGDIADDHWAGSSIAFVSSRELFQGTSENTFTPNAPTTRGQLMTVLARLDGKNISGAGSIQQGAAWASEKGISDGSNPNATMSRQQLATMLWRYADSPESSHQLTHGDAGKVAGYAQTALAWAVENGIMNGDASGNLNPEGTASRAHVAAMVERFCNKTL